LLAALCADPVPDVRSSALEAIGERAASAVVIAAVTRLALGEPVGSVRAQAVNLLAEWLPSQPQVAGTLAVVADKDSLADIRNVAKNALHGI
jgi:HEAT repeat protein